MKKILQVPLFLLSIQVFSQGEMTLPMMEHVYQSTYYNPAAIPDHKVSIGLPVISSIKFGYNNTGLLLTKGIDTQQNGIVVYDIDKLVNSMPKNNYLHIDNQIDFFHLRFKWRNSFVSLDAGNTTDINLNIPKDFFEFATLKWSTPGSESGRTFDFSTFETRILNYNRYSFGLNKMFRNVNIGGRFNLLQGIASSLITTDNLQIAIGSDAISLNNSATIYTSGINKFQDTTTNSQSNATALASQFKNLGGSIDFGITYKFRDRLFLGVSANNIGYIDWKYDVDNTKYYQTQEKGPFTGVDVFGPILRGDSLNNIKFVDSLQTFFKTGTDSSIKTKSYRTWLTPRVYLNFNYKITDRFNVSALIKFEKYIEWRYAVTLGAQYKFGKFLSLTASSTYQYENFNFGGGIVIKPGPFQIYVVADNLFSTLYNIPKFGSTEIGAPLPYDAKAINVRLGMNLVFGKIQGPKKQSFNY